MTLDELERACDQADDAGLTLVQLVVPHPVTGLRTRLFGRSGPLSEEIACTTEHGTVAWWKVTKIRKLIREARRAAP